MKRTIDLIRTIVIIVTISLFGLQSYNIQGSQPIFYNWSEWSFPLDRSGFTGDALPDSGFFGYSACIEGEPRGFGYPFHSGIVRGVNDTISVGLELFVWRCGPIVLTGLDMDSCVMPVVYNDYVAAEVGAVFADTSTLSYCFDYWSKRGSMTIAAPPDTIRNSKDMWDMNFLVWGLPLGHKVVDLVKTGNAPSTFNVIRDRLALGQYWYSEARDVKDTINAYIMVGLRALDRKEYTQALAWTDSVFAINDSSIAGWLLKSHVYAVIEDTASANQGYIRIRSLIENNHDPLIDQTNPDITPEEKTWLNCYLKQVIEAKIWNDMEVRDGGHYYRL